MSEAAHKALLRAVKEYEAKGVPAEFCAAAGRIITTCERRYASPGLEFKAALKVVAGQPKFLTFVFQQPRTAAFIFFSYGPEGRRLFNRKVFDQMAAHLAEHRLVEEFVRLLNSELFSG